MLRKVLKADGHTRQDASKYGQCAVPCYAALWETPLAAIMSRLIYNCLAATISTSSTNIER